MNSDANPSFDTSYFGKLDDVAVVWVGGEDASEFLSNQFVSDIKAINTGQAQQSAWCDPKGRVLFSFQVCKMSEAAQDYYCIISAELVEKFCQRLKMFVLRSAVTVEALKDIRIFGIHRTDKDRENLDAVIQDTTSAQRFLLRRHQSSERLLVAVTDENAEGFMSAIKLPEDRGLWLRDQILLGLPNVGAEASGKFLPQNLNLDALGGLSFSKGCYPGQEVIARLKYRGKVKQRLTVVISQSADKLTRAPEPMTAVFSVDDEEKKIGAVLLSETYNGQLFISAVLDVEYVANHGRASIPGYDTTLTLTPPPYAIDE